eukprot:TRINITY_DN3470_c0_g1_i2.p2 TRINITY_DN3470_c0_g1~~TRINITY_DN3470_c0_g1_i2.p2  ORF type:complete len:110 (+),score=14.52 TRINITY_DN3470_c0_g1_i2:846-1175(+)
MAALKMWNLQLVNPPYSDLCAWIKFCIQQFKKKKLIILLIPLRPMSKYWHEYIFPFATGFWFLPPITFSGYKSPLPIPLCLVRLHPVKQPLFHQTNKGTDFPMWTFGCK